jgi:TonB family protein
MIAIIFEAALRSFVLGALVWLALKTLRIKHPQLERNAWLVVLMAALTMPWMMQIELFAATATPALPWYPYVQMVAITAASSGPTWITTLLEGYVAVAGILLVRQAIGLFKAWRLQRGAELLDADSHIRASERVRSPLTVFSTIIVPANFLTWSNEQQRATLAHEASHVARFDFYLQQLAHLHRSLFWFNPLAWWLARRLSILNEHISDDAALRAMPQGAVYAEFLLSFAKGATHGEHAVAMARPTTLIQRIDRILSDRANPPAPQRTKRIAVFAAIVPLVFAASGVSTSIANEVAPSLGKPTPNAAPGQGANGQTSNDADGIVLPRSNPARPLSQPVYPPPSRRLLEAGTVVLRLHVLPNGRVSDAVVEKSSGFLELDNAARYESFRWQLDAGTVNGTPSPMWGQFAVTFKLNN